MSIALPGLPERLLPPAANLHSSPAQRSERLNYFRSYIEPFITKYGKSHHLEGWVFDYSTRMTRVMYKVKYHDKCMIASRNYILSHARNEEVFAVLEKMIMQAMLGYKDSVDRDKFDALADELGLARWVSPRKSALSHRRTRTKRTETKTEEPKKKTKKRKHDPCCSRNHEDSDCDSLNQE